MPPTDCAARHLGYIPIRGAQIHPVEHKSHQRPETYKTGRFAQAERLWGRGGWREAVCPQGISLKTLLMGEKWAKAMHLKKSPKEGFLNLSGKRRGRQ